MLVIDCRVAIVINRSATVVFIWVLFCRRNLNNFMRFFLLLECGKFCQSCTEEGICLKCLEPMRRIKLNRHITCKKQCPPAFRRRLDPDSQVTICERRRKGELMSRSWFAFALMGKLDKLRKINQSRCSRRSDGSHVILFQSRRFPDIKLRFRIAW